MNVLDLDDPRRRASAHCFVADLDAPELTFSDRHHVRQVLRLRPGEPMTVSDGLGSWRCARFDGKGVELAGPIQFVARAEPELVVGFSLLKGDKPDIATQKLCELGVDVIVPFRSERSIPRWDEQKLAQHRDRLERVAREAAMQSRQVWRPRVEPVRSFREVTGEGGYALADPAGEPLSLATPRVLVGPEGGWGDDERTSAPALVTVGPGILRAETAAIAVGSVLAALRAGLVEPAGTG